MGLESTHPVSSSSSMMKIQRRTVVDVDVVEVQPDWQMTKMKKKNVQRLFDGDVKAKTMTKA